jgi:hypothetical protein
LVIDDIKDKMIASFTKGDSTLTFEIFIVIFDNYKDLLKLLKTIEYFSGYNNNDPLNTDLI